MGNDITKTVANVAKVEVLWESFGTDEAPKKRDLITALDYDSADNYIYFETSDNKGNALIAAKDADNNILWSWHIWMTDAPKNQEYYNGAGTMMDRNLGATSADLQDGTKTLGLLYQWGRKDPFMGGNPDKMIMSTLEDWPVVTTDATNGTIEYSVANPTHFIFGTLANLDWQHEPDITRWGSTKTIYDPCPAGYRVPDGGVTGFWARAFMLYNASYTGPNKTDNGYVFGGDYQNPFTESAVVTYPFNAHYVTNGHTEDYDNHNLDQTELLWTCLQKLEVPQNFAYGLMISPIEDNAAEIYIEATDYPAKANAVRCYKENSVTPPNPVDLSKPNEQAPLETANSYIVEGQDFYKFPMVQGNNQNQTVGTVKSVEVLWESFGTDEEINKRDLIPYYYMDDNNNIVFYATGKEGNALIAAKDADGEILWSWHIWMTDPPVDQVYKNNAGTMMDRNLGATSATPSDGVKTHGLLYQWGRKDPFVGQTDIGKVESTLDWGLLDFINWYVDLDMARQNPTKFVYTTESHLTSWVYDFNANFNGTALWGSEKTIYDPCPPGYQVPDGSSSGIWATALGQDVGFTSTSFYDQQYEGFFFSSDLVNQQTLSESADVWYPCTAEIAFATGGVNTNHCVNVWAYNGNTTDNTSKFFHCDYNTQDQIQTIQSSNDAAQAYGYSVRCYKINSAVVGDDN